MEEGDYKCENFLKCQRYIYKSKAEADGLIDELINWIELGDSDVSVYDGTSYSCIIRKNGKLYFGTPDQGWKFSEDLIHRIEYGIPMEKNLD